MKIGILSQTKYVNSFWFHDFVNNLKNNHEVRMWSGHTNGFNWDDYDLVISLLYDKIVKNDEFDIPKMGTINIHPSLLPSGRGSCPNFWAIAEGNEYAGWTAHRMTNEIDRGAIYHQLAIPVHLNDTGESLWKRLFDILPAFLFQLVEKLDKLETLDIEQNGVVHTLKQFHEAHNLNKAIEQLASPELVFAAYYILNLVQACSFTGYEGAVLDTPDGKVEFKAFKHE